LKPGERYDPWTSETARLAGELGIPPKRLETIVRGYFATFGMFLMGISDSMIYHLADFPQEPTKEINDYPLVGRFMRAKPSRHTKYRTRFYDILNEADQFVATIKHYRATGDTEKARELATKSKAKIRLLKSLRRTRSQLTVLNRRIKRTWQSTSLAPDKKRETINALVARQNMLTKKAYAKYMNQ